MGYSAEEKRAVDEVLTVLKRKKIPFRSISRLEVNHEIVKGRDSIIVVGGDGTFLKTAQFTREKTPFLCVKADPKTTEGFFSRTTAATVEKKLDEIMNGRCRQRQLWRLIAKIEGKEREPCLNEYYIGQQKPYDVARYLLQIEQKKKQNGKQGRKQKAEEQKSSGVLVSTAAGSTAWCRGAGGTVLAPEKKQFQFVVREPYMGKLMKTKIKKGILSIHDKVIITAKSEGMIVVPDAVGKEHLLQKNAKVEISFFEKPIYLFY